MSDLVTLDQVRDLLKNEKIRPEDVFDAEALKPLQDEAAARGYAEGVMSAAFQSKPAEAEKKPVEPGPEKYIDPKTNPFIRTDGGE